MIYTTPMYVRILKRFSFSSMNKAPKATTTPSKNQPITIPEISGKLLLNPCLELCAAERRLLGPGNKETGKVKTSMAIKFDKSMILEPLK